MSDHEQRAQLELVQIAAVVASILEAKLHGATEFERWVTSADGGPAQQGWEVLEMFAKERQRQDEKWGDQEAHGVITWAMILAEEIGEWAEELRISDQEQTEEEYGVSAGVLKHLVLAGEGARRWLSGHEWPERQQQVFDEEAAGDQELETAMINELLADDEEQDRGATPEEAARDRAAAEMTVEEAEVANALAAGMEGPSA